MRVVLSILLVLGFVQTAAAHMVVLPEESEAGGWEYYRLVVPTEKKSPTIRVELKLPPGIEIMGVESKPGWQASHEPFPIGAARLIYSGGRIPPGQLLSFDFLAWNPKAPRTIKWDATQWYEDGTSDHWGEPGNADRSASETVLRESTGARAHHEHAAGGTDASAPGAAAAASGSAAAPAPHDVADASAHHDAGSAETHAAGEHDAHDHGDGHLATLIALAALVLSAVALVVAVRGRAASDRLR